MSVTDVNQRKFSGKSDGFWLTIRRQVLKGDRILLSSTGLERERWGFDIKCNNEAVCNTLILEYFLLPVTIGSGIS